MNMKKKCASCFLTVSFVLFACLALLFASCSDSTNEDTGDAQNSYIRIALQKPARTILPEYSSSLRYAGFTLYGAKSGEDMEELASYENETELLSATLALETGTWTFILTAKEEALAYSGSLTQEIQQGENSLFFTLMLSEYGAGTGNLSVTINCPSETVKWVTAELVLLEDESSVWTYSSYRKSSGIYSIQKSYLSVGMYRLKVHFYADTEATLKLATYSELVRIATGLTSTASRTIDKLNELYTITYNLNGGSLAKGRTAQEKCTRYNAEITLPQMEKNGYEFLGWATSEGGEKVYDDEDTITVSADTELYALWQTVSYGIVYELNGGTLDEENPSSYTVETPTITLQNPTRTSYTFAGWYTNSSFTGNKITQISKGSYGNKTLYAKWTPTTYTITYNLNGGTNDNENPASYTIESETITLAAPTRTGYIFAGWYTDEYYSADITEIPTGSTENKNLYAKWEHILYTADTINEIDLSKLNETYTIYVIGDITNETVKNIGDKIQYANHAICLDLSEATGLTEITANDGKSVLANTNYNFKELILPNTIESIGNRAFLDCNFTSISLPNSLMYIGDYAFFGCYKLSEITLPQELKSIGEYAFCNCGKLESLEIPEKCTSIGQSAFQGCRSLEKIYMSNSVSYLGVYAFSSCTKLVNINIPEKLTNLEMRMFYECTSLTEIIIPNSIQSIECEAFEKCTNLKYIIFDSDGTWFYKNTYPCSSGTNEGGTEISVTDKEQNAINLTTTYVNYYWYKE